MSTPGQAVFAVVGTVIGALAGNPLLGLSIGLTIGGILFPATSEMESDPTKPMDLQVQSSQYGIPIKVVYGTGKIVGNLIWYGNFIATEQFEEAGGKGGGGGRYSTGYTYTVSMAFGLCMGTKKIINGWAGKDGVMDPELSPQDILRAILTKTGTKAVTAYDGTQTEPNAHLASFVSRAPVWKNLCYVVFENYDLGHNPSMPNFTFEVGDVDIEQPFQWDSDGVFEDGCCASTDMVGDDDYLYTIEKGAGGTEMLMRKYLKSDLSFVDSALIDSSGVFDVKYMTYNEADGFIYVVAHKRATMIDAAPREVGTIYKINTDLTVDTIRPMCFTGVADTNIDRRNDPYSDCDVAEVHYTFPGNSFHIMGNYAYITGEQLEYTGSIWEITSLKVMMKVPLDLTTTPDYWNISLNTGYKLASDGTYLYGVSSVGQLRRWRHSDHSGNTITLSHTTGVIDIAIDDTYIYVLTSVSGTPKLSIIRVSIASFSEVDELINEDAVYRAYDLRVNEDKTFLYAFGADHGIWRVKLSTFTSYDEAKGGIRGSKIWNTSILDAEYAYEVTWKGSPERRVVKKYAIATIITLDANPADIVKDVLTNNLYSIGLNNNYLDSDAYNETYEHCKVNDILVSMVFDRQMSILDVLQYIISHHDGFITYRDAKIFHQQLKEETPIGTLSTANNDFVEKEDKFPIEMAKAGANEYNNKILVEYTKRAKGYIRGIATIDDSVDIAKYGVRDKTVKLNGFMTFERAAKMGNLLLRKSLANPEGLTFKLGLKNIDIAPGDVWNITDSNLGLTNLPVRILTVSEAEDGYIDIQAQEEKVEVYAYASYGDDVTTQPPPLNLIGDPGNVIRPLAVELPALYAQEDCRVGIVYSKSGDEPWAGASLYKAYGAGGSYAKIATKPSSGITGKVIAVGTDNYDKYIDLELDWDYTLTSAIDFDDLMNTPRKNLMMIVTTSENKFIRFQDVTLIGTNQWRLKGLIYDTVNFPQLNTYGDIAVNDEIGLYENLPFVISFEDSDKGRTIYFKLPSFNFVGFEESLAGLAVISEYIDGLDDKPLPVFAVKVNSDYTGADDEIIISAGDIALEWMSRNRFNTGGYNYERTDVILDDVDFKDFTIKIYNESILLRTVTQTGKSFIYTSAMQSTDGGLFNEYTITIKANTTLRISDGKTITVNTI